MSMAMFIVVFHPAAVGDLSNHFSIGTITALLRKTEGRLSAHPEPDGRMIKRLHHIVAEVFFEYKVRPEWRAIFYIDHAHHQIRVLGYVPKNLGVRLFDRELEVYLTTRYGSLFTSVVHP